MPRDNDVRTRDIHITKAEKEKNHKYLILPRRENKEFVPLVMGTFGGWGEQTKLILQVIFELTAERDNIPYHTAANMIRRRLQAHLMNWIGADLQQGIIRKEQYLLS